MHIVVDQNEGVRVLKLSGDLLKDQAVDLIEALVASLGSADYVVIHLKEIGRVDPYFLSQICTAHKISLRLRKKIIVSGNMEEIQEVMSEKRSSVCTTHLLPICAEQCIWRMKESPASMLKETA